RWQDIIIGRATFDKVKATTVSIENSQPSRRTICNDDFNGRCRSCANWLVLIKIGNKYINQILSIQRGTGEQFRFQRKHSGTSRAPYEEIGSGRNDQIIQSITVDINGFNIRKSTSDCRGY